MAIKVGGTTVIDDSRNVSNVGSVTATSFSGDGSGLTNLPGGISPSDDIYPHGIRVGRGPSSNITNAVLGYDAGGSGLSPLSIAIGYRTLYYAGGTGQTVVGSYAMENASSGGEWMVVVGAEAAKAGAHGNGVVIGAEAFKDSGGGSYTVGNTFIGREAGWGTNDRSNNNLAIGPETGNFGSYSSGNIEIGSVTGGGAYLPAYNGFGSYVNNRLSMGHRSITGAYVNVSWSTVSDARDKTDIAPLQTGLDFVDQLKPVSYKRKKDRDFDEPTGGTHYGFLAQDVLEVEGENPVIVDTSDPECLTIRHDDLIPILVNSVKELHQEVLSLKQEIKILKEVQQ